MKIKDRILLALQDSAKTNKEFNTLIPDKSTNIISATISFNKNIFLRLDKGYVGLRGRDEHLVTGNRIVADKFCLYKKTGICLAKTKVFCQHPLKFNF